MFVPLLAPHCPFTVAEPWFSMHSRDDQPLPVPPLPDNAAPAYLTAIRERYGISNVGPQVWQEVAAAYHGMVSRLDHHVGRIIDALDAAGVRERTVIAFFSDHGEYLGDFGVIEKWPSAMHPCITRDPLIISGAGIPTGQVCDAMVEMIDVFPTLLDLADVPTEHFHYGRSLRPLLAQPDAAHRDFAFTEGGFLLEEEPRMERGPFPYDLKGALQHEQPALVGKAFAIRSRDWTYIWRMYEGAELYDRRTDGAETQNLVGDAQHELVARQMQAELLRWLATTADVLPQHRDPRRVPVDLPQPRGSAQVKK
jgi:arylsulfatase A-like enzyme